jgi:hypothetical protein
MGRRKSEREAWAEIVEATGGYMVGESGVWGTGGRVEAPVDGGQWRRIVSLDVYIVPVLVGKVIVPMPFARAVATFPTPAPGEGLRLSVSRANPFTGIGKLFGMQDIEVGDTDFDRAFVVKGNDPERVRELLGGESGTPLRQSLENLPGISFGVSDDGREADVPRSGTGEAVSTGSDVIYAVMGAAGSEELVALFNLVAETLRGLYRIGAAAPTESPTLGPATDRE